MRTKLRSKSTLLFVMLGLLIAIPAVAALADTLAADADLVQSGNQAGTSGNPIDMGTVRQGGSVSKQVSFQLVCNGNFHVDEGQTVTLSNPSSIQVPTGGSINATNATIGPIPASWPDDNTGCGTTSPTPIEDNSNSTVTFNAPANTGTATSYTFSVKWSNTSVSLSPTTGDDGQSVSGNTDVWFKVTVDNTAPTVTSVTPAAGATGVGIGTNVDATFSEAMDASTISGSTFTLKHGTDPAVNASVSYDSTTKKATLNPTADLDYSTNYTATVTTGAKDIAGNALASNKTWSFTTAAPACTTPANPVFSGSPNGDNGWYTTTPTVSATSSTSGAVVKYSDAANGTYSTTAPSLGQGQTTVYAKAFDSTGNCSTAAVSQLFKVDTNAPTISPGDVVNNTWRNSPLGPLSFTASDPAGGSGLAANQNLDANGGFSLTASDESADADSPTVVSKTVSDVAGNSTTRSVSAKIDLTNPTITASVDRAANANGWYNDDVTVSFECSDALSGLDSSGCPADVVLGEGANQSVTRTVTDAAGNTASDTVSDIDIDKTAPTVTPGAATTDPNTAGWYKNDVTVNFTASDGLSGLADPTKASFTQNTSGEGLAVKADSGDVYDKAGNKASAQSAGFKIDKTPPTITASLNKTPAPSGWFNGATGAPTVSFQCADALSGVDSCSAAYTFANGADQSRTGTVVDVAGNTNTDSVNNVDVDLDAPNAPTATTDPLNPVANSGGFFKDTVKVSYNGSTDVGPSGVKSYTADQTFNTTDAHNYSGTATDYAGNVSTATNGQVKVDAGAPTVTLSGCPTAPVLLNDTKSITFNASDDLNGSGLVGASTGSVSLDTNSVGPHSKTVTVEDKVGHQGTATCNYR